MVRLSVSAAAAQTVSYTCSHVDGELTFRSLRVQIQRTGSRVLVRGPEADAVASKRYWTYQVIAEASNGAFRASRVGESTQALPSTAPLDLMFGGELFLHLDNGKLKALAVATGNGSSQWESLECKLM